MKVSYFKGTFATTKPTNKELFTVLDEIRNGAYKALIAKIRLINDKDERNEAKRKRLPMVTFTGTFTARNNSSLVKPSGLAMLDFDGVDDLSNLIKEVNSDKYTFSSFVSPSGNGVKVLVKIPPVADDVTYKEYYHEIQKHYDKYAKTDDSTKDIGRGTYISFDSNLYLNSDSEIFTDKFIAPQKPIVEPTNIPITNQDEVAERLEKWFKKRYSTTVNRNTNLHAFARQFNAFGIDKYICQTYLFRYEQPDFRQEEIVKLIDSAYRYTTEWNTSAFEDNEVVKSIKNSVMAGSSDSSIIQKHDLPSEKVAKEIEKHKAKLVEDEFWYYTEKDVIKLSSSRYKNYLHNNNISKYYPGDEEGGYQFIKKDLDFIKIFDPSRIKDFVLSDLELKGEIDAFELCADSMKTFNPNFLDMLKTSEVNIQRDTKEESFIYYQNTAVKTTKNSIELVPYSDIDGLVWEKQVIKRDFKPAPKSDGEFKTFLWKVAGENVERYYAFKSALGYLLHGFQNEGKPKVIIWNDEMISDVPNGGSGKGLIHKAIAHVKRLSTINGKGFDPTKQFAYQTVDSDTQVLLYDDVDKNMDFEKLFSAVTEGLTIEKKGQDAIKIPFADSPKLSITTNYTIKGNSSSHNRRRFELELSSYFSDTHTPEDEFKHLLFTDWSDEEWERFDNYMIRCVQYFLNNGLVTYDMVNLDEKKLINETNTDFIDFMDSKDWSSDKRWYGNELMSAFVSEYSEYKYDSWLKSRTFNKWIQLFADTRKLALSKNNTGGRKYIILQSVPF